LWKLRRGEEPNNSAYYSLEMLDVYEENDDGSMPAIIGPAYDQHSYILGPLLLIEQQQECLMMDASTSTSHTLKKKRRKKQRHDVDTNTTYALKLGPCGAQQQHYASWRVDSTGILRHSGAYEKNSRPKHNIPLFQRIISILTRRNERKDPVHELCIHRNKNVSNEAILASCSTDDDDDDHSNNHSLVTFTVMTRYSYSAPSRVSSSSSADPKRLTNASSAASPTTALDALQMIASKHYYTSNTAGVAPSSIKSSLPSCVANTRSSKPSTGLDDALQMVARKHFDQQQQFISSTRGIGTTHWKIPRHPYLESSKNELWVDSQTGLTYRTDLCQYLGDTRKESGRHTLVGVGQYTRTPLKIKVYGAALYVSKRDVLSDSSFAKYAHMTAEQLRKESQFYDRLMGTTTSVDRTLLIQLNMQMSTETIRSSLQATWRMLTDEMKDLLLNSSFQARQLTADATSKIFNNPNNPSRCSCGQLAPSPGNIVVDPSCCSRGTELVFTWRKNGNLELRLDGRKIDTFPRPDMARGIFYEYLRADEPMSVDAREHFVDGFPFLLAPLAQVRGITSAATANSFQQQLPKQQQDIQSSKTSWMEGLSSGIRELSHHIFKNVDGSVKEILGDLNQRKKGLGEHVASMIFGSFFFMAQYIPFLPWREEEIMDTGGTNVHVIKGEANSTPSLRGATTSTVLVKSRFYDVDENGVIQYPEMNFTHKLFSATVHIYLMLLLIVSLPGTGSTRMVVKRNKGKTDDTRTAQHTARKQSIMVEKEEGKSYQHSTLRDEARGSSCRLAKVTSLGSGILAVQTSSHFSSNKQHMKKVSAQ